MSWIAVFLLGGLVGLDSTAFPQVMISRPLVAAMLTGLLFGRPAEGAIVGVILEAFALGVLPIGAARYPEAGVGAVAATAGFLGATASGAPFAAGLVIALVFALAWERVAGASVVLQRRLNERLIAPATANGRPAALARRHYAAMAVDFARAALLSTAGAAAALAITATLAPFWGIGAGSTLGALAAAVATAVAAAVPLFGSWRDRRIALGIGLVCGVLLLLVR